MSAFVIASPSSVHASLLVNTGGGAFFLSKEATLSGRLCERSRRRDCVKLKSVTTEGTWCEGTWNDWRWKTPDHWSSLRSSTPQAYSWTWHGWEHHSPWSNQWNSLTDTLSDDSRQCGDGRGEVIPAFDGTELRQYERRARLFVSNTRVAPARRAGKLVERLDVHSIHARAYKTWKHRMASRICSIT